MLLDEEDGEAFQLPRYNQARLATAVKETASTTISKSAAAVSLAVNQTTSRFAAASQSSAVGQLAADTKLATATIKSTATPKQEAVTLCSAVGQTADEDDYAPPDVIAGSHKAAVRNGNKDKAVLSIFRRKASSHLNTLSVRLYVVASVRYDAP